MFSAAILVFVLILAQIPDAALQSGNRLHFVWSMYDLRYVRYTTVMTALQVRVSMCYFVISS